MTWAPRCHLCSRHTDSLSVSLVFHHTFRPAHIWFVFRALRSKPPNTTRRLWLSCSLPSSLCCLFLLLSQSPKLIMNILPFGASPISASSYYLSLLRWPLSRPLHLSKFQAFLLQPSSQQIAFSSRSRLFSLLSFHPNPSEHHDLLSSSLDLHLSTERKPGFILVVVCLTCTNFDTPGRPEHNS